MRGSSSSLPNRQLRKFMQKHAALPDRSLPNRQLRNKAILINGHEVRSLPNRQLRKWPKPFTAPTKTFTAE